MPRTSSVKTKSVKKPAATKSKSAPQAPPEPEHSKLSPSGYKSKEICPSYVNSNTPSKASHVGTSLHAMLEKHGVAATEHPEFELLDNEDQMNLVEAIAEYLIPFETRMKKGNYLHHREIRLDLRSYQLPDCDFGTADRLDICQDTWHADLFDYKFGKWEVDDAEFNIQLWLYALGVFANFKKVKTITCHILQPAVDMVSTHTFTRDDILRMLVRAKTIADTVKQQFNKVFNVVFSNCLWCDNKANCAPLLKMVKRVHADLMPEIPEDISMIPDNLNDEVVLEYGAILHDLGKLMEGWGEQMKRRITAAVIDGAEIRGKTLRTVGGGSKIVDTVEALTLLADFTKSDFNELVAALADVKVGELDKYISVRAPQGSKSKAVEEFRKKLSAAGLLYVGGPSRYLVDVKN